MTSEKKEITRENFEKLFSLNVNDKTDTKNGNTYLSWAWAWAEFKKLCPSATYEICKFDGLPYVYDSKTGFMVYTRVTVDELTYEMWLPVMDNNNNAMKAEPYEVTTTYKKFTVKPATMFDINKTIMRCLVKNLAVFGLGLYIYAKEDLPEDDSESAEATTQSKPKAQAKAPAPATPTTPAPITETPSQPTAPAHAVRAEFVKYCETYGIKGEKFKAVCRQFKLNNEAKDEAFKEALAYCKKEVENERRKAVVEAQANNTPKNTVAEALESAEGFLNGIEEV